MSTTSELGLKADAIVQFEYSAEVQAIGIVEQTGWCHFMVMTLPTEKSGCR